MNWPLLQARTNAAVLAVFGSASVAAGTPALLGGVAVSGDFIEPSDQVYLDGASARANVPQFVLLSSAVPALVVGLTLVTGGRSLRVADAKPDGMGLTLLMLELVL